jgi:hypothetical protein
MTTAMTKTNVAAKTRNGNPFDVLPPTLFNPLGSGGNQRHYMAILLRIYELAEYNRFGLTREVVVAEMMDYLATDGADALLGGDGDDTPDDEIYSGDAKFFASLVLRRLMEAGWLEREQTSDYTEYIILPDYAFTLLEALRAIQEQKPREYTGQLYAAHQLLTSENDDFSPALALTQSYESVRQLVRGLNELNQNIRRYTERVTRDRPVAELLRLQYDDYAQVLGPAYHALKTSDHVSRYRRDIVARLQAWQLDADWVNGAADELATQGRYSPAQAADEIHHYLRFIITQLESLDPLLAEIDRRHAQYIRTSLRQIQYQLVGADGGFKDRLALLAKHLAARLNEDEVLLPRDAPTFMSSPVRHPDRRSFYTPPRRRAPFDPDPVGMRVLAPSDIQAIRAATLGEMGQVITPAKIQSFVDGFFNGHRAIHIRDLPADVFTGDDGLPWLIYTIAYGNHPEVRYDVEPVPGEPVPLGEAIAVQPFQLVKRFHRSEDKAH